MLCKLTLHEQLRVRRPMSARRDPKNLGLLSAKMPVICQHYRHHFVLEGRKHNNAARPTNFTFDIANRIQSLGSTLLHQIPESALVDMSFEIEVLQPKELLNSPREAQLRQINNLINDAYTVHGHPDNDGVYHYGRMYTEQRITCLDQIVQELGEHGSIAICADHELPETAKPNTSEQYSPSYYQGKYGQVVAVASVKPWAGKKTELFKKARELSKQGDSSSINDIDFAALAKQSLAQQQQGSKFWDWEVAACASVNDTKYRGQGLMLQCLDKLIENLRIQQAELRARGDPRGAMKIKLWSSALIGSNNPAYWRKRGFVDEGPPDVAPKGLWSSLKDFQIQTLSKVLE